MIRYIGLFFLVSIQFTQAQVQSISFDELNSKQQENPKNTIVLIHTNWCKYCKQMVKEFSENNETTKFINENYNFISFDAETKSSIEFNQKTYHYIPTSATNGLHELAYELGQVNGELNFPTLVILNSDNITTSKTNHYIEINQILYNYKSTTKEQY